MLIKFPNKSLRLKLEVVLNYLKDSFLHKIKIYLQVRKYKFVYKD